MKKTMIAFVFGMLLLVSFANFVSSQEICDKDLDLILTIDNSMSVNPTQFNLIKTNSANFLNLFNSSNQKIGLVKFAHNGILINGLTNNFVQVAINLLSMPQDTYGGTNMADGIIKSTNELQTDSIDIPKYMIIISDGFPNLYTDDLGNNITCNSYPFTQCTTYTLQKAQEAKNANITIYTIGTNLTPGGMAETFMKSVASDNSKYFPSPDTTNLEDIYNQIGTEICGDTTAPTVISTIPVNGATNVPVNQNIIVTFSEAMNPLTLVTYTGYPIPTTPTFVVKHGSAIVTGTLTFSNNITTFNPTNNLQSNTAYTVTITNGVRDLADNNMLNNYVFSFTTGNGNAGNICTKQVDTGIVFNLYPSVPAPIDVPTFNILKTSTKNFVDLFNSNIDLMGLSSFDQRGHLNVPLTNNFNTVKNTLDSFSASGLAPPQDLGEGITKSHEDFLNLRVTNPSRNSAPDVMILLSDGLSTLPVNHNPNDITFSCIGQTLPTNCTNYALEMAQNAKNDGIKIYVIGLNITPAWNGTGYSAFKEEFLKSISSGPGYYYNSDLSSSNLEQIYSQIQTEICGGENTTSPTVISTIPADGETNVPINQHIIVTFSESMNPLTFITYTGYPTPSPPSFIVKSGSSLVTGTLTLISDTATFIPANNLQSNTAYTVTITNGVRDLAGNHMLNDYTFNFTTGNGNQINNANLVISDDSDSSNVFVGENDNFYANYTDANTHQIISTADCKIAFDTGSGFGSWNQMNYTSASGLFQYTNSFSDSGTFDFKVQCSDISYNTLVGEDSFVIKDNTDDEKIITSGKNHFVQSCEPDWKCTGWSDCYDGTQFRECTDANYCDEFYVYGKPVERTACSLPLENVSVPSTQINWLFWILLGVTLILLLVLLFVLVRR